jgi:LmbE family N-acetylglucosaminyl deacetylase
MQETQATNTEAAESTETTRKPCVLALLAHPDDAEILCGGTLIRLREEYGYAVHIATATAGDCGSATLSAEAIARVRREEARRAAESIGATYHCLEQRDANVIFGHEANQKAIDLLRRVNPSLVLTHPRHDYMLDHEQTHLLCRSAAFAFAIPNASPLPLPPAASVPHMYYVDPLEGRDPYTGDLVTPTVRVDVSTVIERKAEMLACHASQREWLREHHGMDEYLDAMRQHGSLRGREAGCGFAEAFVQHAGHAFPANDLLRELFPTRPLEHPDAASD